MARDDVARQGLACGGVDEQFGDIRGELVELDDHYGLSRVEERVTWAPGHDDEPRMIGGRHRRLPHDVPRRLVEPVDVLEAQQCRLAEEPTQQFDDRRFELALAELLLEEVGLGAVGDGEAEDGAQEGQPREQRRIGRLDGLAELRHRLLVRQAAQAGDLGQELADGEVRRGCLVLAALDAADVDRSQLPHDLVEDRALAAPGGARELHGAARARGERLGRGQEGRQLVVAADQGDLGRGDRGPHPAGAPTVTATTGCCLPFTKNRGSSSVSKSVREAARTGVVAITSPVEARVMRRAPRFTASPITV